MYNLIVINDYQNGIPTTRNHFYKMFEYLVSTYKYETIKFSEIENKCENDVVNILIEKFNCLPTNIIIFIHAKSIHNINTPVQVKLNYIVDELHYKKKILENRNENFNKASRILSIYGYAFNKYFPLIEKPIYFFNHFAAFDIKLNISPINKLLISGRLNETIYPFREFVYNISKTDDRLEYYHPNHKYLINQKSDEYIYGEKYIQKLSNYYACFTCDSTSLRPYILAKNFEILSSGSLLVSGNQNTKDYFEKLGFVDNVHYISVNFQNIFEKIEMIFNPNNISKMNEIRENGFKFIRKYYYVNNMAEYLNDILNNKDNSLKYDDGICNTKYLLKNLN